MAVPSSYYDYVRNRVREMGLEELNPETIGRIRNLRETGTGGQLSESALRNIIIQGYDEQGLGALSESTIQEIMRGAGYLTPGMLQNPAHGEAGTPTNPWVTYGGRYIGKPQAINLGMPADMATWSNVDPYTLVTQGIRVAGQEVGPENFMIQRQYTGIDEFGNPISDVRTLPYVDERGTLYEYGVRDLQNQVQEEWIPESQTSMFNPLTREWEELGRVANYVQGPGGQAIRSIEPDKTPRRITEGGYARNGNDVFVPTEVPTLGDNEITLEPVETPKLPETGGIMENLINARRSRIASGQELPLNQALRRALIRTGREPGLSDLTPIRTFLETGEV